MEYILKPGPVGKKRYRIGFLDDNQDNDFHNQILMGISEAAKELDVDVIRFSYYSSHIAYKFSHQVDMVLDHIQQYKLDGLIFLGWTQAGAMYNYDDFMNRFKSVPVLSIGTSYADIPSVIFEGDVFIEKIMTHLIEDHRYRRIAYIEHHRPDNRTEVYKRAMIKHGIYDPLLYVSENDIPDINYEVRNRRAVEILLDERKLDIEAIITLNIIEASFLISELKKRGVRVPGDVAVTSYEDGDLARYSVPGYTTVYFPWRELGYMGCANMHRLLKEGSIPMLTSVSGFGRIIYRESCGCLPYYVRPNETDISNTAPHGINEITKDEADRIAGALHRAYDRSGIQFDVLTRSFISACRKRESRTYLAELVRQLEKVSVSTNIEELASDVRRLFFPYLLNDTDMLLWAGDLFLQSQVLINEKGACQHGNKVLEARMTDQSLQLVSQMLLFNFSLKNLVASLEKGMPMLNIKNCYIFISNSIFTDSDVEENLFDNSVLIFNYRDGKAGKTTGVAGNLRHQLSEVLKENHENISLAYLLHVTDEIMGFSLFGLGPMDEIVYQTLSTHISTALRGIVLLNRLNITYKKLVEHAQKEGMADIATNILHNIGNILNSINVSAHLMEEYSKSSFADDMLMASRLLKDNMNRLEDFVIREPKGKKLLQLYLSLGRVADKMQYQLEYNLDRIKVKIGSINEAVTAQQSYAGVDQRLEELYIEPILSDALKLSQETFDQMQITVEKKYEAGFKANVNRAKLFFIIFNIISNASDAMSEVDVSERRLIVAVYEDEAGKYLRISDNGKGIPDALLGRIFEYGFTTKSGRDGYGLYSCASYMADMGGSIWAENNNEGKGASLVLRFS